MNVSHNTTPMLRISLSAIIVVLLSTACSHDRGMLYKNPAVLPDERVEDLLARMTLDEKISQLYTIRIHDTLAWDDQGNFIGTKDSARLTLGVGAFWSGPLYSRSPEERVACINGIQRYLMENSRLGIPAFVFGEGLHGYMTQGATSFPQAIGLGCTWDTVLIEKIFTAAAVEARSHGVTQVLSPVLDLARDPRWGRTEECYSEDPYLTARMALAAVNGWQGRSDNIDENHVAVTLKHFAGHGQPEGGRNIAPVNYSEREFRESHLVPFEVAVKEGKAQSVMASYNEWDGMPNHVNKKLLTNILRNEWGFEGFVMSDGGGLDVTWRDHHAAADSAESGILSLKAGVDYDLGSSGCFDALADQVEKGLVSLEEIDRAVRNVLRVKFRCGLFDNPYADVEKMKLVTNSAEHRELALEAARKSMVLLKNEGNILPLDPGELHRLAVIGPNADEIHLGGYTAPPMQGITALDGIREYAAGKFEVAFAKGCRITLNEEVHWLVNENPVISTAEDDRALIREAVAVARASDAVILILGENELINREAWNDIHLGDVDHLNLVGQQNSLAKAILETGKPVIVLLINGRPLSVNYLAENADAIIEGWYLGQETGHAVADVLFGEVNPSGKLSVTIPRNAGQLPCYYNHKPSRFRNYLLSESTPLWPFGYGLSYSSFTYSNLYLESDTISRDQSLRVKVDVSNTGDYDGEEIVQLYIRDLVSVPTRPVLELKDFSRIALQKGETGTVEFLLTPEKFASLDLEMKPGIQAGDFAIMVGKNSVETLADTVTVRK